MSYSHFLIIFTCSCTSIFFMADVKTISSHTKAKALETKALERHKGTGNLCHDNAKACNGNSPIYYVSHDK